MMAEAVGKATGRPGICFVTRGPGATNASPGVHIAQQDSTPMILFVGQVAREMREREAFQELDYRAVFGTMAKWATEIDDPARIPEIVSRAFYTATNGRPGPVVIALPEDMLIERVAVPRRAGLRAGRDLARPDRHGAAAEAAVGREAADRAASAAAAGRKRPARRWRASPNASRCRSRPRSAARICSTRCIRCYAGDLGIGPNPKLLARIKAADLIVLIGGRLGEMPSQSYTLFDIPGPRQTFVHVHPGAEELGRVYHPHLAINASPTAFAAALEGPAAAERDLLARRRPRPRMPIISPGPRRRPPQPGGVNLGEIMVWLRDNLPDDAIICNGAGNFSAWIHRFYRFRHFATHIGPMLGLDGLWRAVGGRDEARSIRSAPWSASPATAIS